MVIWSAPVLKTSTSAAEHLPVPRTVPQLACNDRQRGNMADDSQLHKDSTATSGWLVRRMRLQFRSRDLAFSKVQNLEPRTEDDFQPRPIVNLADLVSQSPSAVESESKHTRLRWKQNQHFFLPENQHNRELKNMFQRTCLRTTAMTMFLLVRICVKRKK